MKKIILKIGRAINALCRKTYWYNEVLFPECSKFWNHNTFNLDIINLGSTSSVHAFDYGDIKLKCANWAISHNPLSGDEALLKNYMSYLNPKGSNAILSLCPFSALSGSYDCNDDRYYTLLYSSSIPSFSKSRQNKVIHMKNRPIKYYPLYEILKDCGRLIVAPLKRDKLRILSEKEMIEDSERWMKGWLLEFSISDFDNPLLLINQDATNDAISILNRILDFCEPRNIKPVFVIPPMYHTLSEKFNKNAREQLFGKIMRKMEERDVRFLNYMDDPDFSHIPELFKNSFYLNKKGAKLFTRKVLADISLI